MSFEFLSHNIDFSEDELETFVKGWTSVFVAVLSLGVLLYLHTITAEFSKSPRIFPRFTIQIGIVIAVVLVIKEVFVLAWESDRFEAENASVLVHLTGEGSEFSLDHRVFRLASLGVWTVAFFKIAQINVLFAIALCYPLITYALGIRNRKLIATATVTLFLFVFVAFILILQMPLDTF